MKFLPGSSWLLLPISPTKEFILCPERQLRVLHIHTHICTVLLYCWSLECGWRMSQLFLFYCEKDLEDVSSIKRNHVLLTLLRFHLIGCECDCKTCEVQGFVKISLLKVLKFFFFMWEKKQKTLKMLLYNYICKSLLKCLCF